MSDTPLKVTVMGPGGVGGYFGARLAAAGSDVTFIARGAHLQAMRARGLRLDSEISPLHLAKVKVAADAREVPAADAVIFAVKMRDTEQAAEGLRGLVGKGASVFTFQNGVESADRIGAILGADKVVQGTARIGASISEPGVIKQIGTFARLDFGERDGRPSARTTAFHQACKAAGINEQHPARAVAQVLDAGADGGHDGPDARSDRPDPRQSAVDGAAAVCR
jgi:2-dehydropantoate 2-reductase